MSDLPTPRPFITPETELFWSATTEERLLLRRCTDCETVYFYPRELCPDCLSEDTEWTEASGEGVIYTYTVTRQTRGPYGDATPYVLAYVELEEGPRIVTNIVECDPDDLEIGQAVEVVFDDVDDEASLYRFRPQK
ncbi:Zn-ribbon domain-containing OB-fold protein [Haloferax sp. ATB1]|uniref:Zn-ribbon domain-containing OB-fold protein n=1 Tax=Haloferax sp. ATB1 TaxID=1508454 RepID=UPI0005B22098|nr:Zn-ribbon domain-containing OB-fold protein [Haloferax sp. ATB1]